MFQILKLLYARMAVRYGTFRIWKLRIWKKSYRTSVMYFNLIFEAYRTYVPYTLDL